MKTLSIILWIIGSFLVVAGAFFKIMHYVGSVMLMTTGFIFAGAGLLSLVIISNKTKTS